MSRRPWISTSKCLIFSELPSTVQQNEGNYYFEKWVLLKFLLFNKSDWVTECWHEMNFLQVSVLLLLSHPPKFFRCSFAIASDQKIRTFLWNASELTEVLAHRYINFNLRWHAIQVLDSLLPKVFYAVWRQHQVSDFIFHMDVGLRNFSFTRWAWSRVSEWTIKTISEILCNPLLC